MSLDLKTKIKTYLEQQGDILKENYEILLNNIKEPIVCETCFREYEALQNPDINLRDFIQIDVGFTEIGIQLWCKRHNKNICHIDFEGKRPFADFRCLEKH